MSDFKLIVITPPWKCKEEAGRISDLIDAGVQRVHIRKPDWSRDDMIRLIESIKPEYHRYLKLHSWFDLCNSYQLAGIHLNRCNRKIPSDFKGYISISLHSVEEIDSSGVYEYETLSPIFDSISKSNYQSRFKIESLRREIAGRNIIALGGVEPSTFQFLKQTGFIGGALLGYIWGRSQEDFSEKMFVDRLNLMIDAHKKI